MSSYKQYNGARYHKSNIIKPGSFQRKPGAIRGALGFALNDGSIPRWLYNFLIDERSGRAAKEAVDAYYSGKKVEDIVDNFVVSVTDPQMAQLYLQARSAGRKIGNAVSTAYNWFRTPNQSKLSDKPKGKGGRFGRRGMMYGSGPIGGQRPGSQIYDLALSKISRPLMKLVERNQTKIMNTKFDLTNLQLLSSRMTGLNAIGFVKYLQSHAFTIPIMPSSSVNGGTRTVMAIKSITYRMQAPLIPYFEISIGSTDEGEIVKEVVDETSDFIRRGTRLLYDSREHNTFAPGSYGNETPQGLGTYYQADPDEYASDAVRAKYGNGFLIQSPYIIGPIFHYKATAPLSSEDDNEIRNSHTNWNAWVLKHSPNPASPNLYDGYKNWEFNLQCLQTGMSKVIERKKVFKDSVAFPGYSLRVGITSQVTKPWFHAVAPPFLFGSAQADLGPYLLASIEVSIEYEERAMTQAEYIKLTNAYPNCLNQGPDVNAKRKW